MKKTNTPMENQTPAAQQKDNIEEHLNSPEETPHLRRKRIKEEERQRALAEKQAKEVERLAGIPARLFQLQVEIAKFKDSGVDVSASVVTKDPEDRHSEEKPGLYVRVGRRSGYFLSLTAEEWDFQSLQSAIDEEMERMAEEARQRSLAAEVKSRLSADELEALKKFG